MLCWSLLSFCESVQLDRSQPSAATRCTIQACPSCLNKATHNKTSNAMRLTCFWKIWKSWMQFAKWRRGPAQIFRSLNSRLQTYLLECLGGFCIGENVRCEWSPDPGGSERWIGWGMTGMTVAKYLKQLVPATCNRRCCSLVLYFGDLQ